MDGLTHFLTRTLEKVSTEMSLQVLAYKMKRMINIVGVKPLIRPSPPSSHPPASARIAAHVIIQSRFHTTSVINVMCHSAAPRRDSSAARGCDSSLAPRRTAAL